MTKKILISEDTVKLALEALRSLNAATTDERIRRNTAIADLREALAEQPAQQQEPVAILNHAHGVYAFRSVKLKGLPDGEYALYTSPQPAVQPLTEEQIEKAAKRLAECMDYPWGHMPEEGRHEMRNHVKATIEAANNIKEQP